MGKTAVGLLVAVVFVAAAAQEPPPFRTGRAMSIPLAASIREDADGSRWRTMQLSLAPLATGDYVIEITRSQSSAASS
jgi:hypothetical protein